MFLWLHILILVETVRCFNSSSLNRCSTKLPCAPREFIRQCPCFIYIYIYIYIEREREREREKERERECFENLELPILLHSLLG